MRENARLRAIVARRVYEMHEQDRANGRGDRRFSSTAPYATYGSLIGKYKPIARLLSDEDLKFLDPPFFMALRFRRDRRRLFLRYVSQLRAEAGDLLSLQAESGAADRRQTQRDKRAIDSALRNLTFAAWMHCLYLPGLSDRIYGALRDINGALWIGQVVQMPSPQSS